MTDKLFDEFVKSKLENYNSGAPMHVWERMKKEKDDRKGFFFFRNRYLLVAALLLFSTCIGYVVINTNTTNSGTNIKPANANKNDKIIKSNSTSNTTQEKNTTETANLNVSVTDQNPGDINSTETVSNKNDDVTTFINNSDTKTTTTKKQNKRITDAVNSTKGNAISEINTTADLTFTDNSIEKKEAYKKVKANNTIFTNAEPSFVALQFTGYQAKISPLGSFKIGNVSQEINRPSCPTISGPRRRDLFLEAYVSPDYNVRNLTAISVPGNYISERQNNETYRSSFSAGVRLVKNLGEKTLLKGGLNYSQINERLKIVSENAKQTTQIITIRTVVRAPGDTLFIRDTMYFEQTGTKYRTTYNRYRFIDLPIIFSYEFGNPDLMHFSVNAGPIFNITSIYSGEVLDTSFKPTRITTANGTGANNWRNNIGIGFYASVSIYKKLNDRIHLFGEPYMRYNFNPVTQSSNIVKQRYVITGMQLGIRYNLLKQGQRYR